MTRLRPGDVYGALTVIESDLESSSDRGGIYSMVRVRCICGSRRTVDVRTVRNGRPCGCGVVDYCLRDRYANKTPSKTEWRRIGVQAIEKVEHAADPEWPVRYAVYVGCEVSVHDDFAEAASEYVKRLRESATAGAA